LEEVNMTGIEWREKCGERGGEVVIGHIRECGWSCGPKTAEEL
jgi:hypothetical protein